MAGLSATDRERIARRFDGLTRPVRLVLFTQTFGCDTCPDARRALNEVAELSEKVSLEECNVVLDRDRAGKFGVDRAPTTAVVAINPDGTERDYGVRFLGVTAGYEFGSLVDAILLVSAGDSGLSSVSRTRLAAVNRPITIRVFVTPTCPHCPRAVTLAHQMAVEQPFVTAVGVEVTEFPDLVRQYRVNGVPKTVVDERNEILGAHPEDVFVQEALDGLTETSP